MTAQSKIESEDAQRWSKVSRDRAIRTIFVTSALNVFSWLMLLPVKPEIIIHATDGDAALSANVLASMTSAGWIFYFLTTPFYGQLADRFGRRIFLLSTPVICTVARLGTFFCADGSSKMIIRSNQFESFLAGGAFPLFLLAEEMCVSDLVAGEDLAKVGAGFVSLLGLGFCLAPYAGSLILQRYRSPKYVVLATAIISALQCACVWKSMPETLDKGRRRRIDWVACNPFSFVRLYFQSGVDGAKMRILCVAAFLASMRDEMQDIRIIVLKTKLGFGEKEIGRYLAGSGFAMVMSGLVGAKLMDAVGTIRSTLIALISGTLSLHMYASATRAANIAIAEALNVLGGGNGLGSMITTMSQRKGMGKGDVVASLTNMTTFTRVIAPMIYASLFARFGQKAPFRFAALLNLLATLLFRLPLAQRAAREATQDTPRLETAKSDVAAS